MLIIPQTSRGRRLHAQPPQPSVAGPVLLAATFHTGAEQAVLTFDRTVQVHALLVNRITVNDPNDNILYGAASASVESGNIVLLELQSIGDSPSNDRVLNATGDTGIVAVNGVAWAGVTDFAYGA